MKSNLPDKEYFLGKFIPGRNSVTIVKFVDSGNDGHVFRGSDSILRRDFACKIIPRANLQYVDGADVWRREVHKADALNSPVVVKFTGIEPWKDLSQGIDCVVLLADFVEGVSLRTFIKKSASQLSIPFVTDWLSTMLNLFNEMSLKRIDHGDLHAGNILVEDRSAYELLQPYAFRVTDFGVAEATSEQRFKDDYDQLADILRELLSKLPYGPLSPKDKYVFNALRRQFVARHLVERDLTRDPIARRPPELMEKLRAINQEYELTIMHEELALLSPFDFLNCEQIGDAPDLLHALYSDRFLGLPEIEGRNNVVLTGPRGCGKTTVFRNLSLDQRLRVAQSDPNLIQYLGVYYRCDDLYFAFPRYTIPERADGLDIPIHFVTAALLGSLLELIQKWASQWFPEEFQRMEAVVARALWETLRLTPPKIPTVDTFKALIAELNKERAKARERQRFIASSERDLGWNFGPDVLQSSCMVLSNSLSFLTTRPIYFFIDDYSLPKVSATLQANLNRLFMQRASVCFFKLSTESPISFVTKDIDDKVYVESREYVMHNLGLVYLQANVPLKLTFVEDVFRRRLDRTVHKLPVKELVELVGSNDEHNNNELARFIRSGDKPRMWGREVLCMLCSGDIHYLITLVSEMVRQSGGREGLTHIDASVKISEKVQNDAIRQAAGNFLKNLRSVPNCGEQLVAIVEAFGNVANSHLKFLDSKNEAGSPPKQASRVEPYEPFRFSERAQRLYDELIRYSVFIEDCRGKSRRGHVVPRLYLRRFLIPHFNLTFSTRDSIELESTEFEAFLLQPLAFENLLRLKTKDDADRFLKRKNEDESQLRLEFGTAE